MVEVYLAISSYEWWSGSRKPEKETEKKMINSQMINDQMVKKSVQMINDQKEKEKGMIKGMISKGAATA